MRYFLHMAYDGTNYRGWQRQQSVVTVQETLEDALERVIKHKVTCIGCGRTDAGVHASDYYVHIWFKEALPSHFLMAINNALPEDIVIYRVWQSQPDQHAQYSANARTYHYHGHTRKDAFKRNQSTWFRCDYTLLDKTAMQSAAHLLTKYNDYLGFCKAPDKHYSTLCEIHSATFVFNDEDGSFRFEIIANHFLRGMIRLLIAQLVAVGEGKVLVETFESWLINKERPTRFIYAPPQGLYLAKVAYPFELK